MKSPTSFGNKFHPQGGIIQMHVNTTYTNYYLYLLMYFKY